MTEPHLTFRRYRDGDDAPMSLRAQIFIAGRSYKCPTYVQKTPPCQNGCPAGADIRGWIDIVRGVEKPPAGVTWQEYAFARAVDANPFPAILGRVCPAPCEEACNRNEVDEHVGVNAIEHYIGDYGIEHGLKLAPAGEPTGRRVALVGGGCASLACAYQLRRMGHACTIFEERAELGGMMRYGIPGYRVPREALDHEIRRILDLGVEARTGVRIGVDVELEALERDYDAVFIGIGAQAGAPLIAPGADAPNCLSGIVFLEAFNGGRLLYGARRVLVIGGGDTAMDVASACRRLGHVPGRPESERPENVVQGRAVHDPAVAAGREDAEVTIVYRRPLEKMPASKTEIQHAAQEGVKILASLAPVSAVLDNAGRAVALRVVETDWVGAKMVPRTGAERDIPCDLIISAIGQSCDFTGLAELNAGRGSVESDSRRRWPRRQGVFVGGDAVRPHLLATAIGHAWTAAQSIDHYLRHEAQMRLPKVNVHHFSLHDKLRESGREPTPCPPGEHSGTDSAPYAIHNFEDRSRSQVIAADELFLGHFQYAARLKRSGKVIDAGNVLGNSDSRIETPTEAQARAEADRCMSCGLCFECDSCLIYCPQQAISRVKKSERTLGRYVETDYAKCIGCHICMDVCPTGYIQMGLEG